MEERGGYHDDGLVAASYSSSYPLPPPPFPLYFLLLLLFFPRLVRVFALAASPFSAAAATAAAATAAATLKYIWRDPHRPIFIRNSGLDLNARTPFPTLSLSISLYLSLSLSLYLSLSLSVSLSLSLRLPLLRCVSPSFALPRHLLLVLVFCRRSSCLNSTHRRTSCFSVLLLLLTGTVLS